MLTGLSLVHARGSGEKVGLQEGWTERWQQVQMPAQCQAEGQKGQSLSNDDFWDLEHPAIPGIYPCLPPHLNPPGAISKHLHTCYFL